LRHKKEGGLFKGTPAKQKEILKMAFTSGFTYIDISYRNPVLEELSTKEKKHLLLSYHENKETPDLEDLLNTLGEMRSLKPAIIKIATFVDDREDIVTLAVLLKQKEENEKMIVIGMGKKGEITRFTFPTIGSCIAFVTMQDDKNIAPGMLTEDELLKKMESRLK
jgi:3-dehydroquinate dehydratase type I